MKALLTAAAVLVIGSVPVAAANLCNCCTTGTAPTCATACATVKPAEGMCLPTVDFAGSATITDDQNPLYDVPLKSLNLKGTRREDLEGFRMLLEAARKGAEKDRRASLRASAKGTIDQAAAAAKAKRYDDAIVNYYLGMNAYRLGF